MKEDIKVLDKREINEKLKEVFGWKYKRNKISKEFQFDNFVDALNFINQMKDFFERNDHHPDVHIFYNKILFELQRFDVGGYVTNMDFIVAKEIDKIFQERFKGIEITQVKNSHLNNYLAFPAYRPIG